MPLPVVVIATVPSRAAVLRRLAACLDRQTQKHELHIMLDGPVTDFAHIPALGATHVVHTPAPGTGAGFRWAYSSLLPRSTWVLTLDDDVCEIPDDYVARSVAAMADVDGVGGWAVNTTVPTTHRVPHICGNHTVFRSEALHGLTQDPLVTRHLMSPWSGFVVNGWWAHRQVPTYVLGGHMTSKLENPSDEIALLWRRFDREAEGRAVLAELRDTWGWPTEAYETVLFPTLTAEQREHWNGLRETLRGAT